MSDEEGTFKFVYQYSPSHPKVVIELHRDSTLHDDVLPAFEGFLKAAGYVFDGEIVIAGGEEKE
jgi:hypothetical protein